MRRVWVSTGNLNYIILEQFSAKYISVMVEYFREILVSLLLLSRHIEHK